MKMEISVVPVSEDGNVAPYLAEMVKIIAATELEYKCTPMSLQLSGDKQTAMDVARQCHEKVMSMTDRAFIRLRMDEANDASNGFESELKAVEEIVGKKIKT